MPRDLTSLLGGVSPTGAGTTAPNAYQQFNTELLGMLKSSQQLGTAPFVRQGLDAQMVQANRVSAQTPQSLIGAAPSVQAAARSASAQAVNPTVQGAQQSAATFGEQLNNFGNLINFTRQINSEAQASQERAQDRAFAQIMSVIDQYGGAALQGLDEKAVSDLEKTAGLPSGFLNRVASMKTIQQQQFEATQAPPITPYQQQSLELDRQQMAQQQSQFQSNLNQPMTLGAGQTVYNPATKQADYTAPSSSASTPDLYGSASSGYYTYDNGQLKPVPIQNVQTSGVSTGTTGTQGNYPTTNLQPGATGPEVEKLQRFLVANNYLTQQQMDTGPGIYGPQTTAAVAKLQNDLAVDNSSGPGYWGPKTIAALSGETSSGASGSNDPSNPDYWRLAP